MNLAENLKAERKRAGLSQEKLAEIIGVARQTVTKWETGAGVPDIENLLSLSSLFGISADALLNGASTLSDRSHSLTEYDIDYLKKFDINFGGAKLITLRGCEGEKLRIRLSSDILQTNSLKIKLDDNRSCTDINLNKFNGVSEADVRKHLKIEAELPVKFTAAAEIAANTERLELYNLECGIEFDGKAKKVIIDSVKGSIALNSNTDMDIDCRTLHSSVEINQLNSSSRICLPKNTPFRVKKRGIGNSVLFEKNGKQCESFADKDADCVIELNGVKSELIICTE